MAVCTEQPTDGVMSMLANWCCSATGSRLQAGSGRFVPAEFTDAKDLPDAEFPLVLNTGRVLEHWHTGTMTRRSYALDALEPTPFVEVNPADLAAPRAGGWGGGDRAIAARSDPPPGTSE